MGIEVIFIPLARHIIPLNRETQNAIDFAASIFDVLPNLAISHVARICPAEAIRPLEHRRRSLILRRNQRHHILLETILHKQFQPSRSRQHVLDELVDADFLCTTKLLRINRNSLSHCFKRIHSAKHTRSSITVAEQDIIGGDIVQSSKSATQTVHVTQLSDSFLCILQHLLSENRLGTLIVCRSNNLLKGGNGGIHIHTFAQIDKKSADSGVTDTKLCRRSICRGKPYKGKLFINRQLVIINLIVLKLLYRPLKLLTTIQAILSNQLQHSINSLHG